MGVNEVAQTSLVTRLLGVGMIMVAVGCSSGSTSTNTPADAGGGDPPETTSASQAAPTSTTEVTGTPSASDSGVEFLAVELEFEDPSPGGQQVWIVNHSDVMVDLSCWNIASAATQQSSFVSPGQSLVPGAALRFTAPAGLLRSPDTLELRAPDGSVVESTPELRDDAHDDQLWYRADRGPWTFGRHQFDEPTAAGQLATDPAACEQPTP